MSELSQRDAVCKNLKEENKDLKLQVTKLKAKPSKISVKKNHESKSPLKMKNKLQKNKMNIIDNEVVNHTNKEYQDMLKRIALVNAENIKLSSKLFMISNM